MQTQAALQSALLLLLLTLSPVSGCSSTSKVTTSAPVTEDEFASLTQTVRQTQKDIFDMRREMIDMRHESAALKLDSAALKQDNAALKQQVTELQQDNTALKQQVTELQETMTSCLHNSCTQGPARPDPPRNTSSGGATYVRWGRTSCPLETDLVYKGYAGGSFFRDPGAAVDYLCLPENPQYSSNAFMLPSASLFGGKYKSTRSIFSNENQGVPCAVCRSPTRSSAIMIPARTSCYGGFHREYYGYLMAGAFADGAASEYVCVDSSPENVAGGAGNGDGKHFFFTISYCGSLKCPPYVDRRPVTCVVCSK